MKPNRIMPSSALRGIAAIDGTTKARIERAALTLFTQEGIDGVSTKRIAAKAGVSEGAIYRHFESKDTLARSLMVAIHDRLTLLIQTAGESQDNLADQIDYILQHYCHIADDDWVLFQYHIFHLHHFKTLSERVDDNPIMAAAALIETAHARNDIETSNTVLAAAMALGVVLQSAQAKVMGFLPGPLSTHIPQFRRAIFALLAISEA